MTTALLLKSSVVAYVHRGVIRGKPKQSGGLMMSACVVTAFLFVGLMVFGIL